MSGRGPFWIHPGDTSLSFPDTSLALREPDGLLAIGGDLAPERLLAAYRKGIFPWYGNDQPILWWSPDPRTVLFPGRLKISRSLRKRLRQGRFRVTLDRAFDQVIRACAEPRPGSSGTWITREMSEAYCRLHQRGYAHSVECWHDDRLVGGLYGVALGAVFFGESMFSRETDASKVAFAHLVRQLGAWNFALIDCQVYSPHLATLGAERIPRSDFVRQLDLFCDAGSAPGTWKADPALADNPW
ncbi:MAG: leucyl/phenylalanyl-tRNA--protein transferase [Thiogranum sp.]|nr:leucyl/phenylalanyl-tRNA--protein transferase [Thiogranum sp.]